MSTIYFDMDGTIADLYGVEDWLSRLRKEDATPYEDARPLYDMVELCRLLGEAVARGHTVGIITWLAKEATKEYKQATIKAKKRWLAQHFPVEISETHFIQYGTRKDYVAKDKSGIIFDDDARVRAKWRGKAYDPIKSDIIETLREILGEKVG